MTTETKTPSRQSHTHEAAIAKRRAGFNPASSPEAAPLDAIKTSAPDTATAGIRFDTPLGVIHITASDAGLMSARFDDAPLDLPENALCREAAAQVRAYLAGERHDFDLPLAPKGTPFQESVWTALLKLPFGVTTCYSALAAQLGRPTAARAVGAAIGRNPLWLIIPCHRVIGRNGSLTGYAGGLARKRALLELEGAKGLKGNDARA